MMGFFFIKVKDIGYENVEHDLYDTIKPLIFNFRRKLTPKPSYKYVSLFNYCKRLFNYG